MTKVHRGRLMLAKKMVDEFALRIQPKSFVPAFPYFASESVKSVLVTDLRRRLERPYLISQANASLCGPASFFYCLVQDAPDVYVKLVEQLFCEGRAQHHDLRIEPSRACRQLQHLNTMALLDWICLGSLRDSANRCFAFAKPVNTFKGITWPGELAHWFTRSGYNTVENRARLWPHQSEAHLQTIAAGDSGGHYCLFVGVQALGQSFLIDKIANHWVVLNQAPISAAEVNVFTWGQQRVNFNQDRNTVAAFCPYYFGYVYAADLLD